MSEQGSSNECGCQLEVYGQRHSRECLEHEITRLRRALADEQAAHKGTAALARAAPETLSDDPFLADRANGVHGIYCIARVINGTTEYWTGQEWAAFCNDLYFDLRPAQKASESPEQRRAAIDAAALADAHRMYEAEHGEPFSENGGA